MADSAEKTLQSTAQTAADKYGKGVAVQGVTYLSPEQRAEIAKGNVGTRSVPAPKYLVTGYAEAEPSGQATEIEPGEAGADAQPQDDGEGAAKELMVQFGGGSYPISLVNEHLKSYQQMLQLRNGLAGEIANTVFQSHMINQGLNPNDVGDMQKAAGGLTPKEGVTTTALQNKQKRGAPQMAMPEFPDKDKAVLGKMIGGAIASTMKNIAAAIGGKGYYAGMSPDPLAVTSAQVSKMLATSVAEYQKKVDDITRINAQLLIDYNNDIDRMMDDVDKRMDAASASWIRNTQTLFFNMIHDKNERQLKQIEFNAKSAEIPVEQELKERGLQQSNVNIKNARSQHLFDADRQDARAILPLLWKTKYAASRNGLPDFSEQITGKLIYSQEFGVEPALGRGVIDKWSTLMMGLEPSRARALGQKATLDAGSFSASAKEYAGGDKKKYNNINNNALQLSDLGLFIKQWNNEVFDALSQRRLDPQTSQLDNLIRKGYIMSTRDRDSVARAHFFGAMLFDNVVGGSRPGQKERESGEIGTVMYE